MLVLCIPAALCEWLQKGLGVSPALPSPDSSQSLDPQTRHPAASPHYDPTDTEAECMGALSPGLQLSQSFCGAQVDEVESCPEEDAQGVGERRYRFGPDVRVCSGT